MTTNTDTQAHGGGVEAQIVKRVQQYDTLKMDDHRRRYTPAQLEMAIRLAHDASPAATAGVDAWRDVLAERKRQVQQEGWTPEHDDAHDKHEMAQAAACYALTWTFSPTASKYLPHKFWPWSLDWWKPTDTRGCLVKAGALILAEIERLDRAALIPTPDAKER